MRTRSRLGLALLALASVTSISVASVAHGSGQPHHSKGAQAPGTSTPIKHVVVIYQENVSFDHYFGTYPRATNPAGEPAFHAAGGTPSVNGLNHELLIDNPNLANPKRLDRSQAITCDMDHDYTAEQRAFNGGLMDKFVENTGASDPGCDRRQVMDFYDGNTVTGLWNYAQRFAMSDNSYGTVFGPSTPGALNLVSGQTHGATPARIPDEVANGTVIGDPDPAHDDCSVSPTVSMSGPNVGTKLSHAGVTWGWFQGGFVPSSRSGGKVACDRSHENIAGAAVTDYSAHHEPFQYYKATANPHHVGPSSVAMIGRSDRAHHQYGLRAFWRTVRAGHLPAVSFLKAAKYQDGHAGYSDPLDEQHFLVKAINRLQKLPTWKSTAVVVAYDDSDGWYDHQLGPIVNHSSDPAYDALDGAGLCGQSRPGAYQDRCGYGPRLPLLVISSFSRRNFVDHSITDQTSILRFIEDNWGLGRLGNQSFDAKAGTLVRMLNFGRSHLHRLILDPRTGEPRH